MGANAGGPYRPQNRRNFGSELKCPMDQPNQGSRDIPVKNKVDREFARPSSDLDWLISQDRGLGFISWCFVMTV